MSLLNEYITDRFWILGCQGSPFHRLVAETVLVDHHWEGKLAREVWNPMVRSLVGHVPLWHGLVEAAIPQ
jgi:hypothetical protein